VTTLRLRTACPGDDTFALWRMLEARLGRVPLAVSADWTGTWVKHYGDLVPTRVIVAEEGGIVRGMCLVTEGVGRRAWRIPLRTRHIGTAGEPLSESVCVEYNGLLVEPSYRDEFGRQLMALLDTESGWDELCWDGFARDDLTHLSQQRADVRIDQRTTRYFDLTGTRQAGRSVLDSLGRSTRSNIRRLLKKYDGLKVEWAGSLDEADDIFVDLVELHQARWQAEDEPGAFASERFRAFQHELMARLHPQGRVVLFRIRSGSETVGCLFLLVDRNRLLDYLSGFAAFNRFPGPGIVTHYLAIDEALRRGFDAYDFLVGDKQHKENLSTHTQSLAWAVLRRRNVRNTTIHALRGLKRFLRAGSIRRAAHLLDTFAGPAFTPGNAGTENDT
jgi:CelD/BcsL family acetyltransferase involved in cellulose biosynthesis